MRLAAGATSAPRITSARRTRRGRAPAGAGARRRRGASRRTIRIPGALKLGLGSALAVSGRREPQPGIPFRARGRVPDDRLQRAPGMVAPEPGSAPAVAAHGPPLGDHVPPVRALWHGGRLLEVRVPERRRPLREPRDLYELVRRGCRFIVACDAGMDPGSSSRSRERDSQVPGRSRCHDRPRHPADPARPVDGARPGPLRGRHHPIRARRQAAGRRKAAAEGYLLYIKPSITGGEPQGDVLQYRAAHAEFPHESTSDQWFGESRVRELRKAPAAAWRGWCSGARASWRRAGRAPVRPGRERMFVALKERWYPSSAAVKAAFSRHADRLSSLQVALRRDEASGSSTPRSTRSGTSS